MAPSVERNVTIELPVEYTTPRTIVTYAVNYDVQAVNELPTSDPSGTTATTRLDVGGVASSTETSDTKRAIQALNSVRFALTTTAISGHNEHNAPDMVPFDLLGAQPMQPPFPQTQQSEVRKGKNWKSLRDRGPRELAVGKTRVRYDMQLVPVFKRNKRFLSRFPIWWMGDTHRERHAIRLASSFENSIPETPLDDDSSVVWIPSKRSEWEDSIHEMTSVCTSAAIRRHILRFGVSSPKLFSPPLSKHYIRDRVDIDDPMEGYQIRCTKGGWLQGFILFTNFTTWNHGFKWDSRHPLSGIKIPPDGCMGNSKVDYDGTLADELEAQPRSGDPQGTGIVFSQIAEIGLIGGLGCGEYLLRMALDRIYQKKMHRYVVLDAAEEAIPFYEDFGFIRVGSICRYGKGLLPPEEDTPFSGYSHWTHANESKKSLRNRGGPSYMMCLKLPDSYGELFDLNEDVNPPFLSQMMELLVDEKPKIEPLGANSVFGNKQSRRSSTVSLDSTYSFESSPRVTRKSLAKRNLSSNLEKGDSDVIGVTVPASTDSGDDAIERLTTCFSNENRQPVLIELSPRSLPKRVSVVYSDGTSQRKKRRLDLHSTQLVTIHEVEDDNKQVINSRFASIAKSNPMVRPRRMCDSSQTIGESVPTSLRLPNLTKNQLPSSMDVVEPLDIHTKRTMKEKKVGKAKARKRGKSGSASKVVKDGTQKSYHSVRGPDGKFIRLSAVQDVSIPKPKKSSVLKVRKPNNVHKPIDRTTLTKQKVKSYPRNRLHFYNRVVKPIDGSKQFFFVLRYEEDKEEILLVPMGARGCLSGKREGRPRYQALIGDSDHNMFTAPANSYQVVNAVMIMKTPVVASEAWDIEDE